MRLYALMLGLVLIGWATHARAGERESHLAMGFLRGFFSAAEARKSQEAVEEAAYYEAQFDLLCALLAGGHYIISDSDDPIDETILSVPLTRVDRITPTHNPERSLWKLAGIGLDLEQVNLPIREQSGTVGLILQRRNDELIITRISHQSPAEQAGVRKGDRLLAVDGESVAKLSADDAMSKIRGTSGTEVVLTLGRAGTEQPMEIRIAREAQK